MFQILKDFRVWIFGVGMLNQESLCEYFQTQKKKNIEILDTSAPNILDKEYSTCTSSFTPSSTSLMIQTSHASSG
jgi:hypothetical protein